MPKPVINPALSAMLKTWAHRTGDGRLDVNDLAAAARCSRRSIHLYLTGRQPLPRVEQRMAKVLGLTVPWLRRRLGLGPRAKTAARRSRLHDVTIRCLDCGMERASRSAEEAMVFRCRCASCNRSTPHELTRAVEPPAPPRPTSVQQQPPARTEAEFIARFGGPKGGAR